MTRKEHNKAVKLIRAMFGRMQRVFDNTGQDWDRYIALIEAEERGHRRFCNGREWPQNAIGIKDSVRLFAVRQLLRGFQRTYPQLDPKKEPMAAEYFHIRESFFAAWALLVQKSQHIVEEFPEAEVEQALALDYAELNKEPQG